MIRTSLRRAEYRSCHLASDCRLVRTRRKSGSKARLSIDPLAGSTAQNRGKQEPGREDCMAGIKAFVVLAHPDQTNYLAATAAAAWASAGHDVNFTVLQSRHEARPASAPSGLADAEARDVRGLSKQSPRRT